MAGTVEGGKLAAKRNMEKYGADYYSRIGSKGGKNGKTGGFAKAKVCADRRCVWRHIDHLTRQCAGYRGGRISRRTKQDN